MSELCVVTQRSGPLTKTYTTDRFRLVSWAGEQQCRGSPALPSMWSSSAEKLELYLALFGYLGVHYVLTFDDAHLPASFSRPAWSWAVRPWSIWPWASCPSC